MGGYCGCIRMPLGGPRISHQPGTASSSSERPAQQVSRSTDIVPATGPPSGGTGEVGPAAQSGPAGQRFPRASQRGTNEPSAASAPRASRSDQTRQTAGSSSTRHTGRAFRASGSDPTQRQIARPSIGEEGSKPNGQAPTAKQQWQENFANIQE